MLPSPRQIGHRISSAYSFRMSDHRLVRPLPKQSVHLRCVIGRPLEQSTFATRHPTAMNTAERKQPTPFHPHLHLPLKRPPCPANFTHHIHTFRQAHRWPFRVIAGHMPAVLEAQSFQDYPVLRPHDIKSFVCRLVNCLDYSIKYGMYSPVLLAELAFFTPAVACSCGFFCLLPAPFKKSSVQIH